jgi:hypothetical protein
MYSYSSIIVIVIVTLGTTISIYPTTTRTINLSAYQNVFAHISGNRTQELVNQRDNIKVLFTYEPEIPIIDTFTELKFSVQNLTNGEHITDFLARVVVTNGQRLFKFENITVADGDFSVKYLFPDDGTHQVITRIDTKESTTLASFNVFVPHQSPPSILNPFPSSPSGQSDSGILISKILATILPVLATIALVFMLRKGRSRRREHKL